MNCEELGAVGGFLLLLFMIVYNLGRFVWHRRCPKCKRFFAGKKTGSHTIESSSKTGNVWSYKTSRYERRTRSSALVAVYIECKRCGHKWSYRTRFGSDRKH